MTVNETSKVRSRGGDVDVGREEDACDRLHVGCSYFLKPRGRMFSLICFLT